MCERGTRRGEPAIRAAEYPVELVGKPARAALFEYRQRRAAHGAHPLVLIRRNQSFQPGGGGGGVVVDERHHLPASELCPRVASSPKMTVVFVCQHGQWERPGGTPVAEAVFAP